MLQLLILTSQLLVFFQRHLKQPKNNSHKIILLYNPGTITREYVGLPPTLKCNRLAKPLPFSIYVCLDHIWSIDLSFVFFSLYSFFWDGLTGFIIDPQVWFIHQNDLTTIFWDGLTCLIIYPQAWFIHQNNLTTNDLLLT